MPYYKQSVYYPSPNAAQAPIPPPQQQQYTPSPVQLNAYQQAQLRAQQAQIQYEQAQQEMQALNLQFEQQQYAQQHQQQYLHHQQLQQQQLQAQQLQQQQLQAQQLQAQQEQELVQQYYQQREQLNQQYQNAVKSLSSQRQGGNSAARSNSSHRQQRQRSQSPAPRAYKASEYIPEGGYFSTQNQRKVNNNNSLRRVPSAASLNTAIEKDISQNQFGLQQQYQEQQYNPYRSYGTNVAQSPLRSQKSQREQSGPSEYANESLRAGSIRGAKQSGSNTWIGARSINAPRTITLDQNNNESASRSVKFAKQSPAKSPARPSYGRSYGSNGTGAAAESAYYSVPNDSYLVGSSTQRAYQNTYGAYKEQNASQQQLKPSQARALFAALSSENVRTALERDGLVTEQKPVLFNGRPVNGVAFRLPSEAGAPKFSEYQSQELNGYHSIGGR